ncbi:MAG: cupin domain-containing protein [Desulfosarcinaceae bacterium]|nr:cupin domain-containing protein [Desulfosarcinaceae bacterium]
MDVRQFPALSPGQVDAETVLLRDDGTFPNNDRLPVLVYARGLELPPFDASLAVAALFNQHLWRGCWVSGVYSYPHYHSTAHEALGVVSGSARLRLGGKAGTRIGVRPGDLLILPAGVAHECLSASGDFAVVGAYPAGQRPDLCTGAVGERPGADRNIDRVPLPAQDPLYGASGPIHRCWRE